VTLLSLGVGKRRMRHHQLHREQHRESDMSQDKIAHVKIHAAILESGSSQAIFRRFPGTLVGIDEGYDSWSSWKYVRRGAKGVRSNCPVKSASDFYQVLKLNAQFPTKYDGQ